MRENNSCGKVLYMCDIQGPEKVSHTCVNTMHAGMMDRVFTVYEISLHPHLRQYNEDK
jgi:hypothetical protein